MVYKIIQVNQTLNSILNIYKYYYYFLYLIKLNNNFLFIWKLIFYLYFSSKVPNLLFHSMNKTKLKDKEEKNK